MPSGQEQQQEGERKSEQTIMNPDGDELGPTEVEEDYQEESSQIDSEEIRPSRQEAPKDSVQDDSVSKYNFIFYLLYKFKYDTAP